MVTVKRRNLRYESQSLLSVVDAARSIVLGDWMIIDNAKTTPQAARLISGAGSRAITALISGSSAVINSQLAARGHQVRKICRRDRESPG